MTCDLFSALVNPGLLGIRFDSGTSHSRPYHAMYLLLGDAMLQFCFGLDCPWPGPALGLGQSSGVPIAFIRYIDNIKTSFDPKHCTLDDQGDAPRSISPL